MHAKGFTVTVETVKRRLANAPYVEQMDTWHTPQSEQAQQRFAALNAARRQQKNE
jgi:hypothetical protein